MIFAAGFFLATLLALLIIPAVNRRAERLARRRVEALFPMSISELTAEKDHLRAEFAVTQRRLERKVEEALAAKRAHMEELGRRAVRIEGIETELATREIRIAELERTLADTRDRLERTQESLAESEGSLTAARASLAAIEAAHAKALDELARTRAELETVSGALTRTAAELAATHDRLERREADYEDLHRRHADALSGLEAKSAAIADLETRLAAQTARGDEFEEALRQRRAELLTERQRLSDLYKSLTAEQDRGLTLEGSLRAAQADRDARTAEAATLRASLDELRGAHDALMAVLDHRAGSPMATGEPGGGANMVARVPVEATPETAALAGALAAAREERARLEQELRADNADLRRRIDEVANEIIRAADAAHAPETTPSGKTGGTKRAGARRASRQPGRA